MSDCEIQKGEILLSSNDWQVEGIDGRDQHWWKSGMHLCRLKTVGIAQLGCYISKELSHFVLKIGLLDSLSWRLLVCSNWTRQKWGGGPWQLCVFQQVIWSWQQPWGSRRHCLWKSWRFNWWLERVQCY